MSLIVIRIVPQVATNPVSFKDVLAKLTIEAFDVSFTNVDKQPPGQSVGKALFVDAKGLTLGSSGLESATPPFYVSPGAPPIKNGIIQQIDLVQLLPLPDHYQLEAVGICVIEVDQPATFENLRLAVTLGGQTVPVTAEYFDVPLVAGTTPDPAGFGTSSSGPDTPDAWGALAPSIYLQLPASLPSGSASTLQLSADGTPPAFADLLAAVQKVLQGDPGISVTVQPNVTATAGDTKLQFAPDSAGIGTGMNVSAAGIPAGTTVLGIDNTDPTHLVVTLNQELSATVDSTTAITFTPDLGALSLAQCKNVAYEIVWSQQPPQLPSPPEPPEDLYTDPPNTGPMLTGSTPNPHEGDRQQFEAQLKSYYTIANATADRLTSFVFTLSAAIACQQRSLAATQVLIEFPADPAAGSANDVAVVLSGVGQAAPANFGVPAAYFYALATSMPPQMAAQQRYALATRESLTGLLSDLTTAINAGIVTASESFTAAVLGPSPAAGKPNAAQAARRLTALNISAGAATPLAPLDTIALPTSVDADSGSTLTFVSVAGVSNGMSIGGANIVPGTTVKSFDPATRSVTLSAPILNKVPARSSIVFTPFWSTELQSLVQFWLAFPPTPPGGAISSLSYQPGDDDSQFWPGAANNANAPPTAGAVLNLVLCALTQGAMLPAPFTGALGDAIVKSTTLGAPKTVAELAKVTVQQWTQFFQDNPTWLPDFTQPGDTTARIAAFIRTVQKFFDVDLSGPSSPFVLATSAATDGGNNVLHFLPTKAIVAGMSVSGQRIPSGTTVKNLPPSATGDTDVELTQKVTGTVPLPAHTNVTFSLTVVSGPGAGTPALPLAKDWFTDCISAYDAVPPAYILGNGFDDQPKLQAAAEQIFRGDRSAQAWLVEALNTLDALYKVMLPVSITVADAEAYRFSVVEALYARGFTSPARINELTAAEFKQALAGTVAYDLAGDIQTSPASATSSGGTFQPVNPDGALTNCIPPPCSSPLGPVAYLSGLLNLSAISTCESPFAEGLALKTKGKATLPLLHFVSTTGVIKGMSVNGTSTVDGTTVASVTPTSVTLQPPVTGDVPDNTTINFTAPTLASALGGRRGPLADLVASCANLGTPLPLIDIANECLEYMASQVIGTRPVHGQVYETSDDKLADHVLCQHEPCPDEAISGCHDPARLFAALPEYSTPAVPVSANETVEPRVWNTLKSDFSACRLPYSQALDVSRSYLRHFGSCRFEEMRTFRKCITEFVLKPDNEPQGFADYLWRYPVRIDIAREYLGITPEEYAQLFAGAQAPRCSKPVDDDLPTLPATIGAGGPWQLFGFASPGGENNSWIRTVVQLPEFLARTCLTYCEFYELWQSEFVRFLSNDEGQNGAFPQCEPCCLDAFSLRFPDTERSSPEESLARLAVFIRLWRKLKESCCLCLTFAELRDVCDVLQLFNGSVPNPDFVRELAAFQMLREQFHLELYDRRDRPPPTAVDDHRTHILALWVGPTAKKWGWAIHELCDKIVLYARRRRGCEDRAGDFAAMLASHLDALSKLAGFDPASTTNNCNWHALPTHTLRFAEILAKVTESRFRIAELPYLFTATDDPSDCGPFPMQEECEAQELPLGLPDDETRFSLWRLRRELLAAADDDISPDGALVWRISSRADESDRCDPAEVGEQHRQDRDLEIEVEVDPNCRDWDWRRVATVLEEQLGFASGDVLALAQHFFPHVLERAGHPVDAAATRYISNLPVANTTPAMWAGRAGSPFQYDATAGGGQLWARIPIPDQEVIEQLTALQAFKFPEEQAAIQDLYFQPRAMLARFALLFPDSPEAQRHLIEEREGERRWHYFRRHVALCHRRCHIIAVHLSRHVAYATRQECPEDHHTALLILRELLADENAVQNAGMASWENDNGTRPTVTWNGPNSGAFAALLGLVGTGLVTEYRVTGTTGALVWRDISGALDGFGRLRDHDNAPLPTVLPSLAAKLPAAESAFLDIRNGFLLRPNDGDLVGGAQGFDVTWSGALLVEEEGNYEFWAGAPTPCGEKRGLGSG
ncbi:hypothetical protein OKW37_000046 [Paraburkholderia sp. MM5482-R2]|uniref:hypothetical protein n=1 Tax=Paraburkholderia sp. MM5482-R2 TaxID=2991064 RepID=UPI003D1B0857